jgi:hypothetical protein
VGNICFANYGECMGHVRDLYFHRLPLEIFNCPFETKSCEHFVLNLGFISRPLNRRASAVGPVEIMELKVYPADLCEMLGN